jgi:hypothetical protein
MPSELVIVSPGITRKTTKTKTEIPNSVVSTEGKRLRKAIHHSLFEFARNC